MPGTYTFATLTVTNNAVLSLQADTNTNSGVTISAANIFINEGARLCADGEGYLGSSGPGKGGDAGAGTAGGGYGGRGGDMLKNYGGQRYGSVTNPLDLGSGGGNSAGNGYGGSGGGAMRLNVTGTITINGVLSADGLAGGYYAGGGSGGSIYVTANTIAGSGLISASGGDGNAYPGAGGGGGRVALHYTNYNFTGTNSLPGGKGFGVGQNGRPGTLWLSDFDDLSTVASGIGLPPGSYTFPSLSILSNGLLSLQGDTNSNSGVTITAASITISTGGTLSATGEGYLGGSGPGAGTNSGSPGTGGGGYGGIGGAGTNSGGGGTYGSETEPTDLGSGGGNCGSSPGGTGGGAIRLNVSDGTLTINGVLSADGLKGGEYSGGGSGGSIYVQAKKITGSDSIRACGGDGGTGYGYVCGGGGGGRIAIYYTVDEHAGDTVVDGGTNDFVSGWGQAGTIYSNWVPPRGTGIIIK